MTDSILQKMTVIARLVGKLEGFQGSVPTPQLRKQNSIRTVHGSVAIEGNTLSLEQITAVIDDVRVVGSAKEIIEVQNTVRAYRNLHDFDPTKVTSLLRAHRVLMTGLLPSPGRFRSNQVGIFAGEARLQVAPPAKRVAGLVDDLFAYLRKDKATHAWIKAAIAHYELEFIHPFADGNGRLGRLWHHVILVRDAPVFEFVPFESVIQRRQKQYYATLAACDRAGEATAFIDFSLVVLTDALTEYLHDFRPATVTPRSRLDTAQTHFGAVQFTRKDYLQLFKRVSSATASRDLASGVRAKRLRRTGSQATARYQFVR